MYNYRRVPVIPVRIFQLLGREKGLRVKGRVFGLKCGALLGTYDPNTQLLRTLEQLLFEDSTECLVRLPKSGMMRNGRIYEQVTWVLRTEGKESGLWPTPQSRD